MTYIDSTDWQNFRNIVDDFHNNDNGLTVIQWIRSIVTPIPKMGNDEDIKHDDTVNLNCLLEYNVKRVWPLTKYTDTGEEDKQSVVIMLNRTYLESLNLLDADGNFEYNAGEDKFIINGMTHYPAGDTQVSQVQNSAIWYYLVCRRSDYAT